MQDHAGPLRPLAGLRILDFTTLLPGPLATLILAEAGATVIKVERPTGDELRHASPVDFAMLNSGKLSVTADLKDAEDHEHVLGLAQDADVLVEQFRPGVMSRLRLGYEDLSARNPGLVYCSITGFGQSGTRSGTAGHDLNYLATAGMLGLVADATGRPPLPPTVIADIAAGSYPALISILLALSGRASSGQGAHLDVAMADNVWPLQYWTLAATYEGRRVRPSGERLTGGSPRYQIYATSDSRFIAAAPLEQRFWSAFCDAIGLPEPDRDDAVDPAATIAKVGELIRAHDSAYWANAFSRADCCCTIVATVAEATADAEFQRRGLLAVIDHGFGPRPVMPLPLDAVHRGGATARPSPVLGEMPLREASWAADMLDEK